MISLRNIRKTYLSDNNLVEALKGVSLEIVEGEICGIIGFSGAGKSTLVRCMNLLELPTEGKVFVDNQELTALSSKELREARKNIGMIFQHFNLMKSKTVSKNIAYPLKGSGLNKEQIKKRVSELLNLVGLSEKANSYPAQLSGGQKQRVAIARALANSPKVLLCDEATSALDPQTTQSILNLLKDINKKLGLTIVIITHEMHVVKEICDNVAVMENGNIVEHSDLIKIFTKPKAKVTKDFIATIFQENKVYELLKKEYVIKDIRKDELLAKMVFIGQNTGQAFISNISRKFKIDASILFGNIEIVQNTPIGYLVVKLSGQIENILNVKKYLKENNVELEVISDGKCNNEYTTQCS
ncbi:MULTISPECIES: ATP-binding cassette domain-containing protein [Clostridium]|uniref:ATP-binding cassette domain-containing protein n=1 Tax=Clostridium senegalense TaxID=1465809 RepID=A0A6M0H0V8_9CLOT|nr:MULTISPECIES: ATP-binding cassette domain-containing protein [Clostridium]NEU04416.1 ATP-binding cassette domain-containing protein [Clostridium senegalense]